MMPGIDSEVGTLQPRHTPYLSRPPTIHPPCASASATTRQTRPRQRKDISGDRRCTTHVRVYSEGTAARGNSHHQDSLELHCRSSSHSPRHRFLAPPAQRWGARAAQKPAAPLVPSACCLNIGVAPIVSNHTCSLLATTASFKSHPRAPLVEQPAPHRLVHPTSSQQRC